MAKNGDDAIARAEEHGSSIAGPRAWVVQCFLTGTIGPSKYAKFTIEGNRKIVRDEKGLG